MRQLGTRLVDRGASPKDILFVNFEDPVFLELPADARTLDRVLETYQEMIQPGGKPHLFFDEVQEVEGWARWVRARMETGVARFVVSGSSSKVLEPDVATVLTGRNWTMTLWPVSFRELLRFKGVEVPADEAGLLSRSVVVRQGLADYLRWGGLPEVVLAADDAVKAALLKQYFRDILYRDVVTRHRVRDVRALEQVAHHYLVNTAAQATHNRIKNTYGLAMDQVRSYTEHLEEAYLVRSVPRYSPKASLQARAPRKVYAVDVGMRNAVSFRFSADLGRLAETLVHGQLIRDDDARLFYWEGQNECDFVVWKGARATAAVQVCQEPGELPEREMSGLLEAMRELDIEEGTVVTNDSTFEKEVEGRRIVGRPLWRWLLG